MTGTQINYYFLCHRKLWLFTNKIDMEQNSDVVSMGKFISESTYKREDHEIKIDDIVLDFYDGKTKIIHEVKKSDKMEELHLWQVKYYISVLEEKGIDGVTGEIDYPKLRQKIKVELTPNDKTELSRIKDDIQKIINLNTPPDIINKPFCKSCSYYDLCYV
ncbi:MAG: CRISPR-associated protein Cas4 [Ignavibacteriaceae bacterium]|nr:CRISPR-associated protein Cas4 [Ignavibacteriaceae bacterium]